AGERQRGEHYLRSVAHHPLGAGDRVDDHRRVVDLDGDEDETGDGGGEAGGPDERVGCHARDGRNRLGDRTSPSDVTAVVRAARGRWRGGRPPGGCSRRAW